MNTRLQVEHPVTEMVLGIDLVAEQLRIADGQAAVAGGPSSPWSPGHAIEVRLYAEDAARPGFLPQIGTVERIAIPGSEPFAVPVGGGVAPAGLRLDSGVEDGTVVGPDYDPMLAKLIAWAPTREVAAARLAAALRRAEIDGLVTNRDFLVRLLGSASFGDGDTDTGLLDREDGFSAAARRRAAAPGFAAAAALAAMADRREGAPVARVRADRLPQQLLRAAAGLVRDRRRRRARGRLCPASRQRLRSPSPGRRSTEPRIHGLDPGRSTSRSQGSAAATRFAARAASTTSTAPTARSACGSCRAIPSGEGALAEGALIAPMPGKVLKLAVAEGATVGSGDVLIVLEAMKMEHELLAPAAGTVTELRVAEGDQVDAGAALAVIEPAT